MKKWISVVCICSFLVTYGSSVAWAKDDWTESKLRNVLMDTVYGVTIGAIVGAAISAPQGGDADWGANVGAGVAIGAVAGLVFGLASQGRDMFARSEAQPHPVVAIQKDKLDLSWPTIVAKADAGKNENVIKDKPENTSQPTYAVNLLQYKF